MKKHDTTFLVAGILLSIIPIYTFFGWIWIWNTYPELHRLELFDIYRSEVLFNLFEGHFDRCLTSFIPGAVAGILLLLSLLNSIQYGRKLKYFKVFFFVLNILSTGYALMDLITVPKAHW